MTGFGDESRMRFSVRPLLTALAFAALAGCGSLGEKPPVEKQVKIQSQTSGCLDAVSEKFDRYLKGAISPEEWGQVGSCVADSLDLFTRYVKNDSSDGYTQSDLYGFISNYLITTVSVKPQWVGWILEMKASLLGGRTDRMTRGELQKVKQLVLLLASESKGLIPDLAIRLKDPSPAQLTALNAKLLNFAHRFAVELGSEGSQSLKIETVRNFLIEVSRIWQWALPEGLLEFLGPAKVAVLGGDETRLEPGSWPDFIRIGSALASASWVWSMEKEFKGAGDAEIRAFHFALIQQIFNAADSVLIRGGGVLPHATLDRVVDTFPKPWLKKEWDQSRALFKKALRPLSTRLMNEAQPDQVSREGLKQAFQKFEEWNQRELHLEAIYQGKKSLGPVTLIRAAEEYRHGLTQARALSQVSELIRIAKQYTPLFPAEDPQIVFEEGQEHSLSGMKVYSVLSLIVQQLLRGYAPAAHPAYVELPEFKVFVDDFFDLLFSLKAVDLSVPGAYLRRFREANLFTLSSDGKQQINESIAVYYLAYFLSGSELSNQIRTKMEKLCKNSGEDAIGWKLVDSDCFHQEFYGNVKRYWSHFPRMLAYYEKLDSARQAEFRAVLTEATRGRGMEREPIGNIDTQGYTGLIHYVESLFMRFDRNRDEILGLSEALNAFPVFQHELAKLAELDPKKEGTLEAIFTYLIAHGKAPSSGFAGVAQILAWRAWKPFWNIEADRISLYGVFGELSSTPAPASNSQK